MIPGFGSGATRARGSTLGLIGPPRLGRADALNLDEIVVSPTVHTRTCPVCGIPRIGRSEVLPPERPRPTLQWPDGVNAAHGLVAVASQKDAIPISFFREAIPKPDPAQVFVLEPAVRSPEELGDSANRLFRGPDISGCTGAAIATLCALEIEASLVPALFGHLVGDLLHQTATGTRDTEGCQFAESRPAPRGIRKLQFTSALVTGPARQAGSVLLLATGGVPLPDCHESELLTHTGSSQTRKVTKDSKKETCAPPGRAGRDGTRNRNRMRSRRQSREHSAGLRSLLNRQGG